MGEDIQSAAVPVRISCRYSNGTVVSCVARCVSYDHDSVRVLSAEHFAKGVHVRVLAPFLEGVGSCSVAAISRSPEQPAYFEIELKFLKKGVGVAQPGKDPNAEEVWQDGRALIPPEVARAAQTLASRLDKYNGLRFSQVLQVFLPAQRLPLLAVSAAAVSLLLQEKQVLDLGDVVEVLRRKGRQ